MKFIVGIGNPEKKYDKTRHNIGFRALEELVEQREIQKKEKLPRFKKFQAEIFAEKGVLFIEPETFVNRTGDSVAFFLREYEASPSDFLFLCDDVNLVFGKLRLRASGSAGGHHGLESVIEVLGEDFPRLRIGVGAAEMPKDDLTDYVLGRFSREEESSVGVILGNVASICEAWIDNGFERATSRLSQLQSMNERE